MLKIGLLLLALIVVIAALIFFTRNEALVGGRAILVKTSNGLMGKKVSFAKLSIEGIFSESNLAQIRIAKDSDIVTLLATGDVIPARSVNFQATKRGFEWPYEKIASSAANADITFINLETPLLKTCPLTNEGMVFCGSNENIQGLGMMGVDVVSLANNHAGNHGVEGVKETVELLKARGIDVTGTKESNLVIKQVKGVKFAFLGFDDISKPQPGVSNVDEVSMSEQIKKAKELADVVVVTFHWGVEYRALPDERQIYLGHLAVDSGADLVVGNHPHWIQPPEIYKDKLIMYAHGNTVFDQEWSDKTKLGVLGKYFFYKGKLVGVQFIPIGLKDYGQAYLLEGSAAKGVLDDLKEQALKLREGK